MITKDAEAIINIIISYFYRLSYVYCICNNRKNICKVITQKLENVARKKNNNIMQTSIYRTLDWNRAVKIGREVRLI